MSRGASWRSAGRGHQPTRFLFQPCSRPPHAAVGCILAELLQRKPLFPGTPGWPSLTAAALLGGGQQWLGGHGSTCRAPHSACVKCGRRKRVGWGSKEGKKACCFCSKETGPALLFPRVLFTHFCHVISWLPYPFTTRRQGLHRPAEADHQDAGLAGRGGAGVHLRAQGARLHPGAAHSGGARTARCSQQASAVPCLHTAPCRAACTAFGRGYTCVPVFGRGRRSGGSSCGRLPGGLQWHQQGRVWETWQSKPRPPRPCYFCCLC